MKFIIITCKMIPTLLLGRPEPIMLLELRIMLLSIIPKTSLLCLKLCSGILSDNVKFNNILRFMLVFLHSLSSDIHLHYDSYNVFC